MAYAWMDGWMKERLEWTKMYGCAVDEHEVCVIMPHMYGMRDRAGG
jgi:hypothetical protein